MPATYPIRPVSAGEFPAFHSVIEHAFHEPPLPDDLHSRALARFEFDRTLAAFDGATAVGTAGAYSFRMRVPGALVPVAGVTVVAVLPSHRRRGILTSIMRRQLDDLHEGGEAVAALFASEAGIYRRFGYGPASWHARYMIRRGEGRLAAGAPASPGLRLRVAGPQQARAQLATVYENVLATRPGFFARNEVWWDRTLTDRPEDRQGASPLRCVLAEDDGGPRGYALFSARPEWDGYTLSESVLTIRETLAADPAARAAIWADLLSRDLTGEFHARMQPADDPLLHLLADPRRLRRQVADGLWVRLVDVGTALAQRRYSCPVDVVIQVTDEFCPWNEGRWRLTAGPGTGPAPATETGAAGFAATCERTPAPAGITLPAHALGSAFLGGERLGPMAAAGLISQARPGAVAALSAAMSWDPAPWCPTMF